MSHMDIIHSTAVKLVLACDAAAFAYIVYLGVRALARKGHDK